MTEDRAGAAGDGASGFRRCVVAGGRGQVGRMFTEWLLSSGVQVTVLDREAPESRAEGSAAGPSDSASPGSASSGVVASGVVAPAAVPSGARFLAGDVSAPSPAVAREVEAADLVLLAVPEAVALAAVPVLGQLLPRHALLADTLSVKTAVAAAMRESAPTVTAVSVNPMFAPSLPLPGRPVAAVTVTAGPAADAFLRLLSGWGARVVPVSAEQHDTLTAAQQAATHAAILAFGLALGEMGTDIEALRALAPPPHETMLALLARVASGSSEVYWDVQAGNPRAAEARDAVLHGVRRVSEVVSADDEEGFAALLAQLRETLGDEQRAELARVCAHLFTELP